MKLLITKLFLILLCFTHHAWSYDYNLSICAIFRDEAPYLKEWIEFHRLVGVEHFWLYNNNSQDEYLSILEPYVNDGTVSMLDWPTDPDDNETLFQMEAFNHCVSKVRYCTKWLAVIGIDEFIVPVKNNSITEILAPFEQIPNVGGIKVHPQYFGTSNLWLIPDNKTLIESLTQKALWDHPANQKTKTICRPERVQKFWSNNAAYYPPFVAVTQNGKTGSQQPIQIEPLRIHHYWTRHEKYFFGTKIPRKEKGEQREYSFEEIHRIIDDFDRTYDPTILRYVPALRKKMGFDS